MISTHSLNAGYHKDNLMIVNLNLEIEPRSKCWVKCPPDVGRLLMSIIIGRTKPISGALKIMDKRPYILTSSSIPYFMRNLGLFWPSMPLISNETVKENLFWRLAAIGETRHELFIESALFILGLKTAADVKIRNLPQSERAKVALARAIISRPSLIIVLEPTRDLSEADAHKILRILARLKLLGSTVIIISSQDPPEYPSFKLIKIGE